MQHKFYRLYTITIGNQTSQVAIPEKNTDVFDEHVSQSLPEGQHLESLLNRLEAVLIG